MINDSNHASPGRKSTKVNTMIKHEKILWITRTGVLLSLHIVLQAVTVALGNQLVTGSVVNLMLIIGVMTTGLGTGVTVAILSPLVPTLLGFVPNWPIMPFIALGNVVLVLLWHFVGNREFGTKHLSKIAALILSAAAKFAVLYVGIVHIAAPYIIGLPRENPLAVMFSYPQLITATIGGTVAILMLPLLKRALVNINRTS